MSNQSGEAWLVRCVADWPHSTFHKFVKAGVYPLEWAGGMADALAYDDWHAAGCPRVSQIKTSESPARTLTELARAVRIEARRAKFADIAFHIRHVLATAPHAEQQVNTRNFSLARTARATAGYPRVRKHSRIRGGKGYTTMAFSEAADSPPLPAGISHMGDSKMPCSPILVRPSIAGPASSAGGSCG